MKALALAAVLALAACARRQPDASPTPARCGVEAPRYPDDDSGDMGYVPEPGEVCPR